MPRDPLYASSHLSLQWARVRKTGTWAKPESQYSWFCVISHTARLISISVAHSLLQFKSANGGLQCLCSAAYKWHQMYPPGTHYCLQETGTHPFQNRPHKIIVFPGLCRAILWYTLSLLNINMCFYCCGQCNGCRWWSATSRNHPSFCCTALKSPAVPSSSPLLTFLGTQKCTFLQKCTFCRNAQSWLCPHSWWIVGQEKIQATQQQGKYDGQHKQTLSTEVKIYLQPERSCFFFSYTDETFSSLMRKWSDVTLSSSWISSINAFCTTETSRELSAATAVPHSHCCVPGNESLQFPHSCCRQKAQDYSLPSSGKWLDSNTETTCTEL